MVTKVSAKELNRATLARQLLLARETLSVGEATRRIVAMQAQHAASPYVALWNRLVDFDAAELDTAFTERQLVKATLMRFTLHAVHRDDHLPFHVAMQPSLAEKYFTDRGLTRQQAHALLPELLEFVAEPRSNAEVEEWFNSHHGLPGKEVWWLIRSFAPVCHSPTGGPWSFGQRPLFVASTAPAQYSDELAAAARETLVWRYLEGFGPASLADVAQFARIQRGHVKAAISALSEKLVVLEGPDGSMLYDVPAGLRPAADTPAPPRLMAMWDSALLAYDDRSRIVPAEYKTVVTRVNGDLLPTLLVDGQVAGLWRSTPDGIEAAAFRPLTAKTWKALSAEAGLLAAFLADREPTAYSRYNHWWSNLPAAETRML